MGTLCPFVRYIGVEMVECGDSQGRECIHTRSIKDPVRSQRAPLSFEPNYVLCMHACLILLLLLLRKCGGIDE